MEFDKSINVLGMKILHLSSDFLFTPVYMELLSRMECSEIHNIMYSSVAYRTDYEEMPSNIIISECFDRYDSLCYSRKQKKILLDMLKRLDIKEFNLVHAHFLFSNGLTALRIKKRFNIPYIVAIRNTDINIFFKFMIHLRKLGWNILNYAEKVIFLSPAYREQMLSKYIPGRMRREILEKSIILPNGIDAFWLANKNIPKKLMDPRKIKLIATGTIERNKNHLTTLSACRILVERGYDVQFIIVGRSLNDSIRSRLIREPFVTHIPNKPKEELIHFYRDSDIFIMPSINETFGLVYAEAMSQGLPLVYSKGQGFDRQFEDGEVGYPVSCSSPVEIADKIALIIEGYDYLSERCIAKVDAFDWVKISQAYKYIYQKICC